jgi:hypothetical protein
VDSPGDVDACGCWPPDLGGCADDGSGAQLLLDWIYLHPEIGFPALIRRAAEDEPRALELLRAQCERWPADMLEWASEALGPERAEALFAAAGLARELSDEVVVALLDRYAAGRVAGRAWPVVTVDDPGWAFLGLRVVAVRSEDGDGWGLGFERLGGDREGALASLVLGYGSDAMGGVCHAASGPLAFFVEEREPGARQPGRLSLAGLRAVGPAGPLDLDDGMLAALDLRPGEWTTSAAPADPQLVLALRAYLGRFPDALWRPATELTEALGLEEQRPAILVDSKRFAHVEPWVDGTPPSGSVTFRSLARAIVQRDPSAFVPGIVNTDWRARLSRRAPQPSTSEEPKR